MLYTITFTPEQMRVLNDALIELPFKRAQPLITHINEEIQKNLETRPTGSENSLIE